jgi:hypothetical protein
LSTPMLPALAILEYMATVADHVYNRQRDVQTA